MSELSYHQLIKSTFENTLLHLYFKVKSSNHFVKEKERNKLIIDFLKPKIKQARYGIIKKKLKTVCLMKNKFGSIEKHLETILSQYQAVESQSDVDKLYALLEHLEKSGLETKVIEQTPKQEMDVVYINRAHIDNCFNNENHQIAPISLFIHTNELNKFTKCLATQPYFTFDLCQASEELNNYHYQVHPIR